ncbi:ArpU family phage packaging/lysis transcriptional regulator [Lacticaseibacillus daqingensis]|uniref:ArpU family phage packaging/lysis transcriptional regulator n=1 Tax=Lacticaseibacillus daqingensis TaxID=2486014 RepID=UPI000F76EE39|nr:ArpU family phage packaging/lysis transcriptional regulator [Lacticaseibacillus daqingensis]
MGLVPDIQEQASRDNARAVLKQYRRYSRIVGRPLVDIKSPSLDGMPRTASFENRTEARLVEGFNARDELTEIQRAMGWLSFQEYWVLYYSYCTPEPLLTNEIASRVGLASDDSVDYIKRKALMTFAESYRHGAALKFT